MGGFDFKKPRVSKAKRAAHLKEVADELTFLAANYIANHWGELDAICNAEEESQESGEMRMDLTWLAVWLGTGKTLGGAPVDFVTELAKQEFLRRLIYTTEDFIAEHLPSEHDNTINEPIISSMIRAGMQIIDWQEATEKAFELFTQREQKAGNHDTSDSST